MKSKKCVLSLEQNRCQDDQKGSIPRDKGSRGCEKYSTYDILWVVYSTYRKAHVRQTVNGVYRFRLVKRNLLSVGYPSFRFLFVVCDKITEVRHFSFLTVQSLERGSLWRAETGKETGKEKNCGSLTVLKKFWKFLYQCTKMQLKTANQYNFCITPFSECWSLILTFLGWQTNRRNQSVNICTTWPKQTSHLCM